MIEVIDLKQQKQPVCRAMVCQLNSNEFSWTASYGLHFLNANDSLEFKINELLKIAKNKSIDLLIFPELAIPEKYINKLQEWSREQNGIVVCGSHYYDNNDVFYARCPIIIHGVVYFSDKINPSPLEISPIAGNGLSRGTNILRFDNSPIGNFAVLICADYLSEDIKKQLDLDSLDILCVPSFQKDSSLYHNRMNIDCENSHDGIYIIFSNFKDEKYGDGKSAIFGLMDPLYLNKFKDAKFTDLHPNKKLLEFNDSIDYAILDLNLEFKRPFANRNKDTEPNVLLIATNNLTKDGDVIFIRKISHDDERYKRIDELFVEPLEFSNILKQLDEKKIIFIVGDPGIGKTYTAVKILKDYYHKGYEPLWFSGLEKEEREIQSKILSDYSPSDRQIVYFEDPFGRTIFERRDSLFQIFSPLIDKLSHLDCKIIVTSREEIFEKFTKESLLEKEVLNLKSELNVRNPSYDNKKLSAIFDKLVNLVSEWSDDTEYKNLIYNAINNGKINTPLALRDLIFSSRSISSKEHLNQLIERRSNETIKVFALEILSSTITTKAILLLIYFAGFKGKPFLSEIYNKLVQELYKINLPINASFNVQIRSQIGFRIDQIGYIKTAYKFSHPIYEEAISTLINTDSDCELIAKKTIEILSNVDSKYTLHTINRYVVKYPEVALTLFKYLFEVDFEIENFNTKVMITQKLISTSYSTKNKEYFDLACKLYPISKVVSDINQNNKNWYDLIPLLNLLLRYIHNSPVDFDSSIKEKIIWTNVLSNKIENSLSATRAINLLSLCASLNKKTVSMFIDKKGLNFMKGIYVQLDVSNRKHLIKLISNNPKVKKELISLDTLLNEITGLKKFKRYKLIQQTLFSEYKYYGKIIIDYGAEKAIMKPWLNLLPAGIIKIEGSFNAGTIVGIINKDNKLVAVGIVEYSALDLQKIKGLSTSRFNEVIGYYHTNCAIKTTFMLRLKKADDINKWKYLTQ